MLLSYDEKIELGNILESQWLSNIPNEQCLSSSSQCDLNTSNDLSREVMS